MCHLGAGDLRDGESGQRGGWLVREPGVQETDQQGDDYGGGFQPQRLQQRRAEGDSARGPRAGPGLGPGSSQRHEVRRTLLSCSQRKHVAGGCVTL